MEAIASGVDITQPSCREQLKLLQTKAPVLASFILKHYCGHSLAHDVRRLIKHLRDLIVAPFVGCEPNFPPSGEPNSLLFFPNLPQVRGKRMYEADHQKICADQDVCRKYSSTHPSLTPGIFTLFFLQTWNLLWFSSDGVTRITSTSFWNFSVQVSHTTY